MYKELLEKYGSPLYVYDERVLEKQCRNMALFAEKLQSKLQNKQNGMTFVSIHYSTKANNNLEILHIVKRHGLSVDCMSPVEMKIDKMVEFLPSDMLYVCNNVSAEEMKQVHKNGLLICLDSISQVETWGKMFPGTDIMVRINPGEVGVGHSGKVITAGKATKFGVSEANLPLLFETAAKYQLNIVGTHQHLGSLFLNDKIPNYIAGVKAGLEIVEQYFKNVNIVDLGGGFGVPYKEDEEELNLEEVVDKLYPILNQFLIMKPHVQEFIFEPGRYIPCQAGKLVGTVNAVKYENDQYWIGTDIGMNQLVRPSMYNDSYHRIEVEALVTAPQITANICGNVCESGDVLGKNRSILKPEVGDAVVVHNAGAYGYSMSSNYTGRLRPAEIMLNKDGTERIIRRRETFEDVIRTSFIV